MGRGLLSVLLLACCLLAAIQISPTTADQQKSAKPSRSEDDLRSQRNPDVSDATAAVVDDHVNGTEGANEAMFVKVTKGDDKRPPNTDDISDEGKVIC